MRTNETIELAFNRVQNKSGAKIQQKRSGIQHDPNTGAGNQEGEVTNSLTQHEGQMLKHTQEDVWGIAEIRENDVKLNIIYTQDKSFKDA